MKFLLTFKDNVRNALYQRMLLTLPLKKGIQQSLMVRQNLIHIAKHLVDETLHSVRRKWRCIAYRINEHILDELQVSHIIPLRFDNFEHHRLSLHFVLVKNAARLSRKQTVPFFFVRSELASLKFHQAVLNLEANQNNQTLAIIAKKQINTRRSA